jgi:hypothetical protein
MQRNVGKMDRALRVLLAAGAVAASGVVGFSSGWGIVLLVVAAVMAGTAASGYCPLYSLLGVNTRGEQAATGQRGGVHLHRAA